MARLYAFPETFSFRFLKLITKPCQQLQAQRAGESVANDPKKIGQQQVSAVADCGHAAASAILSPQVVQPGSRRAMRG
jgi:hypothetical protein